ncbi:MAG: IS630 transposase-related protein [Pseudomonadota bacterium]
MAYSLDLRKRAVALLDEGKSTKEIGELLGVSDRSVLYWKKRDEEGRLATHYPKSRGAYTIDDEVLKEHLETHPDAYLKYLAVCLQKPQQVLLCSCRSTCPWLGRWQTKGTHECDWGLFM